MLGEQQSGYIERQTAHKEGHGHINEDNKDNANPSPRKSLIKADNQSHGQVDGWPLDEEWLSFDVGLKSNCETGLDEQTFLELAALTHLPAGSQNSNDIQDIFIRGTYCARELFVLCKLHNQELLAAAVGLTWMSGDIKLER